MDLMAFVPEFVTTPTAQREIVHTRPVEHVCTAPPTEDPLMTAIPGSSVWSRLRRWIAGTRVVSQKYLLRRWPLKSNVEITFEINRHLNTHPYTIHSYSSFSLVLSTQKNFCVDKTERSSILLSIAIFFPCIDYIRVFWESAMTLFIIAALLVTPVFLAFYFDECEKWYMFNHAIDAVFICDIALHFLTGYYNPHTHWIDFNPKVIASNYLRGFFIMDIISVLPLEFLIVLNESLWYLASLNLLKILWMRTVVVYSRKLYHVHQMNFYLFKTAELGIIIVICVHWAACLEYYLPLVVAKIFGPDEKSWIQAYLKTNEKTRLAFYFVCVNRAITSLVGSAHFFPMSTPEDILLNLILSVIGFLGFIYLLARLAQLVITFDSTRKRHFKIIHQLEKYMRHHRLSHSVQQRLRAYYNYYNKKGFERDKKIIDYVSPYLREELLQHNYRQLLNSVMMFRHMPKAIATQLIGCVRSEIFMPDDVLVRAGTIGDALHFIASGTVAVYNNAGREICHLEDGAYFDELALLMDNELRMATVVAVETCEVHILKRVDFQRVLAFYPDVLMRLQNVVLASVEQMPPLEREPSTTLSRSINISSILRKKSKGNADGGK